MKTKLYWDGLHCVVLISALSGVAFVANNFVTHIFDLPSLSGTLSLLGINFFDSVSKSYTPLNYIIGIIQSLSYILAILFPISVFFNKSRSRDSKLLSSFSETIISSAFWAVMLIGIVDASISFVRIEGFLPNLFGEDLALSLGKPAFRGTFVHIPLLFIAIVIGILRRGFDFIWLALLIVFGELLIVITRFIFSYEQAFMGDLVRFWYAGLFLFSSAYTLVHEGHVRVDVVYATFSEKSKAYTNIYGSIFLGIPLCWIVLLRGLWHDTSPLNLALLNFEVTQQGFGMYVKYLMSGFLVVFALSMLLQFSSYILYHMNRLTAEEEQLNTEQPVT